MGTWGIEIKDSDAFVDIYCKFLDLYNKGGQPDIISKKIIAENWEILETEEEKNSLWFALALAQWETKSPDSIVLSTVEEIILEYDTRNYKGKGYLFKPSYTAVWSMNNAAKRQFESELTKPRPTITLTIKQLTKKEKWWKVF